MDPKPPSRAQFDASAARIAPPLERVRDDVWAVGMQMPGHGVPYSLLYLLRDTHGRFHVVDPGWESDANFAALTGALESLGSSPSAVASITITHLHPDHIGMSERIRDVAGAVVQLHRREREALRRHGGTSWAPDLLDRQLDAWGVPEGRRRELQDVASRTPALTEKSVDRVLEDDELLDIPGFEMIAMRTPGHTPGHISLRDDARGLLFTGDHLLPSMMGGIGLGGPTDTNALDDYLGGLQSIWPYPEHEVLPGHGYRFHGLRDRIAETAAHHLARSRQVAEVRRTRPDASTWQTAERLTWSRGWEGLSGFFLYSALWQTDIHTAFVEGGGLQRWSRFPREDLSAGR